MVTDLTRKMIEEHRLILRMIDLLETRVAATEIGEYSTYTFYLDAVDFIRMYADKYHHAKEEDILFRALLDNGMPRNNSPVAAMLMEHDMGRGYVKEMEAAAQAAENGDRGRDRVIAETGRNYIALLREHIAKEDDVIYPLSERLLPEKHREAVLREYADAERAAGADFEDRYLRLVERYENEDVPVGRVALGHPVEKGDTILHV